MDGEISYIKAIHDQVDANNEIMSKMADRKTTSIKGMPGPYPVTGPKFTMVEGPMGADGPWITYIIAPGCLSLPTEEMMEDVLKSKHVKVLLPRATTDNAPSDSGPVKMLIRRGVHKFAKQKDLFVEVQTYGGESPPPVNAKVPTPSFSR
jgi:hypothetical protein